MKVRFTGGVWADVRLDRLIGRECVTLHEFRNGHFRAPAGTRFMINGTPRPGFSLEAKEQCSGCGLYARITKIPWRDVEIVGEPPPRRPQ